MIKVPMDMWPSPCRSIVSCISVCFVVFSVVESLEDRQKIPQFFVAKLIQVFTPLLKSFTQSSQKKWWFPRLDPLMIFCPTSTPGWLDEWDEWWTLTFQPIFLGRRWSRCPAEILREVWRRWTFFCQWDFLEKGVKGTYKTKANLYL